MVGSYLNNRLRLFVTNVLNHVKSWSLYIALGTRDFARHMEKALHPDLSSLGR